MPMRKRPQVEDRPPSPSSPHFHRRHDLCPGKNVVRLVRHLAWRLTSLPADSSPVVSPLQGSDDLLTLTQGSARFTSLALGYPLSGFQPMKFEPRYLGCSGDFANVSASATALSTHPSQLAAMEGEWLCWLHSRFQVFVKVSANATAFNIAFDLFTVS